ncbi:MAG TPA: dihydrofolate reductase family protein [bacterium]|jgi:dihydrofolate reductase|nr:dihydrofolate reductase family protein [bacterium]
MKLTVSSMVSLDGVMQAPGGPKEDSSGGFKYGGWTAPYGSKEGFTYIVEWFSQADSFLLGRKTYQIFANYWPKVTDPDNPIAGPLNALPKYVASKTLKKVGWNNSKLLKGNIVAAIKKLKAMEGKELQVHGSGNLLQTLLKAGLIDELRVITFPVILGKGKRLFGSGTVPCAMELVDSKRTPTGVLFQAYRPVGAVRTGTVGVPEK